MDRLPVTWGFVGPRCVGLGHKASTGLLLVLEEGLKGFGELMVSTDANRRNYGVSQKHHAKDEAKDLHVIRHISLPKT